jgi:hypothetical protein
MPVWVYFAAGALVIVVVAIILFTRRKRVAALLLLLLLLIGFVAAVVDGRVFGPGANPGPLAGDPHQVLPGGTIRDGSVVAGEVRNPNDRLDHTMILDDFTQFSLVDTSAKVDLQLDNAGNSESAYLPGPMQYAVSRPGTYHLTVSLPDGGTGPYTFRVAARRLHKQDVKVGDPVKGHLATPGAVDEYIVDVPPGEKVTIADSSPCEDVSMGYTDEVDDPRILSPGTLCWDFSSGVVENGRLGIVIWSENGKAQDYGFTLKPAS